MFLDRLSRCVDKGVSTAVCIWDLAKVFVKVPPKRLIERLEKHGMCFEPLSHRLSVNFVSDHLLNLAMALPNFIDGEMQ